MNIGQRGDTAKATPLSKVSDHCDVADDANWRRITETANAAYANADLRRSFELYGDALDEAELLFARVRTAGTSVPLPVIYNISCHNLAEIAERSGDKAAAERFFIRAYDKLLANAASPETPLALRVDCTRHLKQALTLLVQHLHRRGAPDVVVANYVDQARSTAFAVFHAARHAEITDLSCNHCGVRPS